MGQGTPWGDGAWGCCAAATPKMRGTPCDSLIPAPHLQQELVKLVVSRHQSEQTPGRGAAWQEGRILGVGSIGAEVPVTRGGSLSPIAVPAAYAPLQPPQFLQQPPKPMQPQQQQFVIQQQQLAPRGQPPPGPPTAPQLQPLPPASPGPAPQPKAGVPQGAGGEGGPPNGHPGCHAAPRKFQHASAVILQLQPAGATVRGVPRVPQTSPHVP